eukprot:842134-Prymnesium_polylepis.1
MTCPPQYGMPSHWPQSLRMLQKALLDHEREGQEGEAALGALREKLARVDGALAAAVNADQADAAILEMRQNKDFFGRLGDVVRTKNLNVWLREWDKDNDGTVSRLEFHHHIRALQIPCSDADLDDTYNAIDRKGEPSLLIIHLRDYLKHVLEKNSHALKEEEKHVKAAAALRKQARRLWRGAPTPKSPGDPKGKRAPFRRARPARGARSLTAAPPRRPPSSGRRRRC